jgi:hypothetical protein
LLSNKVEFIVVGGHAVAYHGYPRFTGDIDLFVRPSAANGQRILTALASFGFGALDVTVADFSVPGKVVQLGRPPNRIDLLTSITGVDFDEAWSGHVEGDLDGLQVAFLGRAELIKNKKAIGRAKDLADIEELE